MITDSCPDLRVSNNFSNVEAQDNTKHSVVSILVEDQDNSKQSVEIVLVTNPHPGIYTG
jgi:hypothetical protein